MNTIKILCLECQKGFGVRHPSISDADSMSRLTTECPYCGAVLRKAEFHLVMESLHTQMRRKLVSVIGEEAAATAEFQVMELPIEDPKLSNQDLPNSPLAHHDELAALRDRLSKERK